MKWWQRVILITLWVSILAYVCGAYMAAAKGAEQWAARLQTFQSCRTAPGVSQKNDLCRDRCDLDCDGDVDQDDFGAAMRDWYVPAVIVQPPASQPCSCPCEEWRSPTGAPLTCQLWVDLPPDMLERLYQFHGEFWLEARQRGYVVKNVEYPDVDGVSLATRPE